MNDAHEPDPVAPPEQPVLDYGVARSKFDLVRTLLALLAFFGSFVVHGLLAIPAVLIGAAGHGSVFLGAIVFPWAFMFGSGFGAVIQCAAYGLVLAVGVLCERPRRAFRWLLVAHGCALVLGIPIGLSR